MTAPQKLPPGYVYTTEAGIETKFMTVHGPHGWAARKKYHNAEQMLQVSQQLMRKAWTHYDGRTK